MEPTLQPLSRRAFLQRASLAAAGAALAELPALLDAKGLLEAARAAPSDVVTDTLLGLAAFILPGSDPYSMAQGESAPGPGAVDSGALQAFVISLDEFVPVSALGVANTSLRASGGVATLLNSYALQVNPAASGPFSSPFANLSFKDKAAVFQRFESDQVASAQAPELKFVAGILPGFVAFVFCSEAGHYDPGTRQLTGTPVSWTIAGYSGPAEGHAELKGYYQGRRAVDAGSVSCGEVAASVPTGTRSQQLVVRFYGRRPHLRGLLVQMYTTQGTLGPLVVELRRGRHVVAHAKVAHLGTSRRRVVLKTRRTHIGAGRYTLVVRHTGHVLVKRRVTVR
ncbi:MAG TPA: twin-arginine translocation signal domain-containing protein [Solirubrobacteraceae bacterium]|nr:twin-arginine translocation signal domain-containing protein [Solirubrobacteraceae bacterium]